jgi:uncharacterized membrane protein AbrB (regulator of aidB expression)
MNDLQWLVAMIYGVVMWEIGCALARLVLGARREWLAQRNQDDDES